MEDFLLLEIPVFQPHYKKWKKYGYANSIERNNLKDTLEESTGGYCMYCYTRIRVDGKLYANITQYEESSKCSTSCRKQCTVPCKSLRKLQKKYSSLTDAEIILQPIGIQGTDSNETLVLQYNVMNMEFEPAKGSHTYSDRELRFIEAHIKRFRLNDPQFRTRQLFDFVKNVIDNNGNLPEYEYNNLIVKLFCEKLANKSSEEILKICKSIFIITFAKM